MTNETKKNAYLDRHLAAIKETGLQTIDLEKLLIILEISRGSFYNYFQTKNDYLIDLVMRIKNKTYTEMAKLEEDSDSLSSLKEQLMLKFSMEEMYELDKMMDFLQLVEYKEAVKYAEKIREINEIDSNWIAQHFSTIFKIELVYCKEGAILFLSMMEQLIQLNKEAAVKSPMNYLIGQTIDYARMICMHNSEQKQTLFFKNQQELEMTLQWEHLEQLIVNATEITEENQSIIEALLEELHREEVRKKVVELLILGIDSTNASLRDQLLQAFMQVKERE